MMSHNFDLQEEYQALQDLDSYELPNEENINQEEHGRLLEGDF
jgi:condensin complex subunit 1